MKSLISAIALLAVTAVALPASANTSIDLTSGTRTTFTKSEVIVVARRGADDPAGHVRGGGKGRGRDDAPNHG